MRLGLHRDVLRLFAVQSQCGELSTPHAAGVDGVYAIAGEAAQRRPVAADVRVSRRRMPGTSNHGYSPGFCVPGMPLASKSMRPLMSQ